jgi:hypothetical protein
LEAARLETVAQRVGEITALNDKGADLAYTSARNLLVRHGRLGEALRVELLLEQMETRIPVPRLSDIASAVDRRFALTALEREALDGLTSIAARWEAIVAPRNWFARLRRPRWATEVDAIGRRLFQGMRDVGADRIADLSAVEDGVAVLRVQSFAGDVLVGLADRHGERVEKMLGAEGLLRDAVYAAMRALHGRSADAVERCRALHEMILKPFKVALPKVLVIQASGALRRIPFGVLFDGERFLLEQCAVVSHPGTQVVDVGRGVRRPVVGISVTVSTAPGFEPLRHATADAKVIAEVVGAGLVQLSDGAATPAALDGIAERRPSLLHISSHFETDPSDAGRSGFVLKDGSRYQLSRLAGVDLSSVDLALVMGCQTRAVADVPGTAGISGLVSSQHGLAGARFCRA